MCAPTTTAAASSSSRTTKDSSRNQDDDQCPSSEIVVSPSTQQQTSHHDHRKVMMKEEEDRVHRATRLGAISIGLLGMATTMALPYAQSQRDELGCDSSCQGNMTSARSTLGLIGATLVGRISDWGAGAERSNSNRMRRGCLFVGLGAAALNLVLANQASNLTGLWMSLIPNMLQQNSSVMRALLSDYHSSYEESTARGPVGESSSSSPSSPKTDRASSAGTLGMAGGFALMLGPFLGSSLLSNYEQATAFALVLLLVSSVCIFLLPSLEMKVTKNKQMDDDDDKKKAAANKKTGLWSMLDVPSARSPAALFVLANRLLSSLSFHMFAVIWLPSLKQRFPHFGPKEYGIFFSMVGLFFALSQGLVSQWVLRAFAGNTSAGRSRLLVLCTGIGCIARYLAFYSSSLTLVYVLYAFLITAIGISSTIVSADTSQIPAPHEVGSFFGILTAVESGAGMAGPLVASALASGIHPTLAPLYAVIFLNLSSVALIAWGYDRFVFQHIQRQKQPPQQQESDAAALRKKQE